MPKPKLSYANVTATLALVFSMTGGAMAAHHYLITSTKQISPKVVSTLKGKTGPAGAPGLAGKEGAAGKEGKEGKEGKDGAAGKEGKEGLAGTARAYAEIRPSGTEAPTVSKAKNVIGAKRLGAGNYCVELAPSAKIDLATVRPVITVNWNDSASFDSGLYAYDRGLNCGPGESGFEVLTADEHTAGVLPTRNDEVTFNIAVP
jgi:hypothetical protein